MQEAPTDHPAREWQRPARQAVPAPQEVRVHLDQLLQSQALGISDRNRRFLAYIVEETLAGRGERIKAYNIALTAFAREEDFDPQTDPIVRIEASRLRRALEHYYLTSGRADPIRIDIPKGSYVAAFRYSGDSVRAATVAPPQDVPALQVISGARGMSLSVLAFSCTEEDANSIFAARSFVCALIQALTQVDGVSTFAPAGAANGIFPARNSGPRYILSGSVHTTQTRLYVSIAMIDAETMEYRQAWNLEHGLTETNLLLAEAAIARQVARSIADPQARLVPRAARQGAVSSPIAANTGRPKR